MNESRNNIFPGPALSGNQYGDVRRRNPCELGTNRLHSFRMPKDNVVRRKFAQRLLKRSNRHGRHKSP